MLQKKKKDVAALATQADGITSTNKPLILYVSKCVTWNEKVYIKNMDYHNYHSLPVMVNIPTTKIKEKIQR